MSDENNNSSIPICVNEIRAVQNDFDTYDIDRVPVGSGGWGTIYRGVRKSDGKVFSLKFFGYTNRAPNQKDINDEIVQMFAMVGLPGVIQIESIFHDTPYGLMPGKMKALQHSYPVLVMEHLSGGDLLHRIDARARAGIPVSEKYLASTFRSAMVALQGIHKRFFIHRDIKVANLLMQSDADDSPVKIIDFGSLIQLDHASMRVVTEEAHGSPMSMAPESLPTFSREYSTASDIWQAGCVLFYMLCADIPFHNQKEIKAGQYNTESSSHPRLSPQARDLIAGMLKVNPRDRLTLDEILHHPWLSGEASEEHVLDEEYKRKVKTLSIRRKLKSLFVPPDMFPPSPPPPPLSQSQSAEINSTDSTGNQSDPSGNDDNFSVDVDAEARYYFDLMFSPDDNDVGDDGLVTKEGLRAGMAKLLNERSSCEILPPHPSSGLCHAGHKAGTIATPDTDASPVLRLTPGVAIDVDEMFNVMDTDETNTIDFEKFRAFYVIATRGHT